jgi:hypothetical protein
MVAFIVSFLLRIIEQIQGLVIPNGERIPFVFVPRMNEEEFLAPLGMTTFKEAADAR